MDTTEHTELGDALRFNDWDSFKNNPYLTLDAKGTLHVTMQGFAKNGLPIPLDLKLTAGQIVAMSGDYFGGREVDFKLPTRNEYKNKPEAYDSRGDCETLGDFLIKEPVAADDENKFSASYKRLANPSTKQKEISTIYTINSGNYIPFSETLNFYVQQLMFALRVKNYGEILNRNLSHFTPWSVRAYTVGHSLALKYAKLYFEINQLKANRSYQSSNPEFNALRAEFLKQDLQELAHRYQALAFGMEFFTFHYYTDHFAAGHQSMVGDLRAELPRRFSFLGGILVNSLHDELNTVRVYTTKSYDPTPDPTDPPLEAGGDGDFDQPQNFFNKQACIDGMQLSLRDLDRVFNGQAAPQQDEYGGLNNMPDVDMKYRQPQPLFILGEDNKIYCRNELSKIQMLAPSELKATYADPLKHGYSELSSIWGSMWLVVKLRVFSFAYQGKLQPVSSVRLMSIAQEEEQLNPGRKPVPTLPTATVIPWQTPVSTKAAVHAAATGHGMLAASSISKGKDRDIEPISAAVNSL